MLQFEWKEMVLSIEGKYSSLQAPIHMSTRTEFHFDPEDTRSQQDTETNKLIDAVSSEGAPLDCAYTTTSVSHVNNA